MEGGQLGGDEWTRHGSFVNKPTRGWLHSDGVVSTSGVSYTVRVSELCSFINRKYHNLELWSHASARFFQKGRDVYRVPLLSSFC